MKYLLWYNTEKPHREDGWQGADYFDTSELVSDKIGLECGTEALFNDIVEALGDQQWCQRDPYGLTDDQALEFGWNSFCEQIKSGSGIVSSRVEISEEEEHSMYSDEIPTSVMLERISRELTELEGETEIIRNLPVGALVWRARRHIEAENPNNAQSLGTVPREKARYPNRMSPAGVPMFYGALDSDTAKQESVGNPDETFVSVGEFATLRHIKVLNLCDLPSVPSLFDENRGHLRSVIKFMHNFVGDLSKPIARDGMEHVEYLPTQVFTEHIRNIHTVLEGEHVLGIIYPSAKNIGGNAIVLFLKNASCCDEAPQFVNGETVDPARYLVLRRVTKLVL